MDLLLVYYTEHGTMTFSHDLIEHGGCNAEIASQAAHYLGIDCEILTTDRLHIHPPSAMWNWEDYHRYYIELLIEKGLP